MSANYCRTVLVLILILATCGGSALAQSIGSQGPATTPSQNYASPSGHPLTSLLALAFGIVLVTAASASTGYWVMHRQE